ncbi:hypothetical protein [Paenibacillus chitinolyticus]|uniref:hypothetical protein n=1 Tax=Paenibacillus chitinolyticus TaxID=79263 RepID=UPI00365E8957
MVKNIGPLFILLLMALVTSCGTKTSTTSAIIEVVSKNHTNGDFWIKVADMSKNDSEQINLKVDNENTWNLINEKELYTISYDFKEKEKGGTLVTIRKAEKDK